MAEMTVKSSAMQKTPNSYNNFSNYARERLDFFLQCCHDGFVKLCSSAISCRWWRSVVYLSRLTSPIVPAKSKRFWLIISTGGRTAQSKPGFQYKKFLFTGILAAITSLLNVNKKYRWKSQFKVALRLHVMTFTIRKFAVLLTIFSINRPSWRLALCLALTMMRFT